MYSFSSKIYWILHLNYKLLKLLLIKVQIRQADFAENILK